MYVIAPVLFFLSLFPFIALFLIVWVYQMSQSLRIEKGKNSSLREKLDVAQLQSRNYKKQRDKALLDIATIKDYLNIGEEE